MSCNKKKSGMGKFIMGAAVGAGLGILFAPNKGNETRKALKQKLEDLMNKIKNVDAEEVKAAIDATTGTTKTAQTETAPAQTTEKEPTATEEKPTNCPKCGAKLKDGSDTCDFCGEKIK